MYSVGEFAKKIGKSVRTLQKWDRDKKLVAFRTPTQRRYYTHQQYLEYKGIVAPATAKSIAYCRVSSRGQKDDLKSQKNFVLDFCRNAGIALDEVFEDFGSGLNFKRQKFVHLMEEVESGKVANLVLAHKDRLVRFGFQWFEDFCKKHGTNVIVINDERLSPEEEIVQDLITIVHVFSSRVYGLRKYKKIIKEDASQNA